MMKNRGGYTWDIHMDIGTAIKNFTHIILDTQKAV